MRLVYGSVCSGIEAASVAWHPLGWVPAWFSEIDTFPSEVLRARWPGVWNWGDFKRIPRNIGRVNVLVGGTPCQSFSLFGLREGLDDPRGNLALAYLRLADALRPDWFVWENVPGVLSSHAGRDFATFLGAVANLRYGFAWRVLDARFFGVPQQRRRLFLVGSSRGWQCASAALFEPESLRRNAQTFGREEETPPPPVYVRDTPTSGITPGWESHGRTKAKALTAPGSGDRYDLDTESFILDTLPGVSVKDRAAIALDQLGIRRLSPLERERIQGFPDGYTNLPGAGHGERCRALGNSMAVPVMRWLGRRIDMVSSIVGVEPLSKAA